MDLLPPRALTSHFKHADRDDQRNMLLRAGDERTSWTPNLALIATTFPVNAGRLRASSAAAGGQDGVDSWSSVVMGAQRIIRLCNSVELLAGTLDKLNARGRGASAQAVLLRMKLAALTAELVAADVIERARQRSAIS